MERELALRLVGLQLGGDDVPVKFAKEHEEICAIMTASLEMIEEEVEPLVVMEASAMLLGGSDA